MFPARHSLSPSQLQALRVSRPARSSESIQLRAPVRCTAFNSSDDKERKGMTETGPGTVNLFYKTAWQQPTLHYSAAYGVWKTVPLKPLTKDQAESDCDWTMHLASIEVNSDPNTTIDFVVSDGDGNWDNLDGKPGENYQISSSGAHILMDGVCSPAPSVDPFLVVSDLDGTMVGNDASTAHFTKYWNALAVPRGCKLVYSSGRSLEQYQSLRAEKPGIMAHPDVYISSVGTKVYYWVDADEDAEGAAEETASMQIAGADKGQEKEGEEPVEEEASEGLIAERTGMWIEDLDWARSLDMGWNLAVVRAAAEAAVTLVGEDSAHFRPACEQNPHKVTLGVRTEALTQLKGALARACLEAEVPAKIISSGAGDWRYVDTVPAGAGKLESLDYVRRLLGFRREQSVACGDSGNDILMLAGDNKSIVVGNAQQDLVEWVQTRETGGEFVVAKREVAYGILEGLESLQLDPHLASVHEWLPRSGMELPPTSEEDVQQN